MTIDEAIIHAREVAKEQKLRSGICTTNDNECDKFSSCIKCAEEHEQLAEWLEELKELRVYKEKIEMQYFDDIGNPLEPIKLKSALESEIMKYEFRKKNNPKQISILDYTIMYALKHCLEELLEVES